MSNFDDVQTQKGFQGFHIMIPEQRRNLIIFNLMLSHVQIVKSASKFTIYEFCLRPKNRRWSQRYF